MMIRYPLFRSIVRDLDDADLRALAARSGVPADGIRLIADGDLGAGLADQMRLAEALGRMNPFDLFALDADLEEALAAAPSRYVSDPAALRIVDRVGS